MFDWLRCRFGWQPQTESPPSTIRPVREPLMDYWGSITGDQLAQGDWLPRCLIPEFEPSFGHEEQVPEISVAQSDLIVVTQSCDLENRKVSFAALCPIYGLAAFEKFNPVFVKKGEWEQVRLGRREGLHLLGSPTHPKDNREALVVDFRQIFSLPVSYLSRHASALGPRWRLNSPFLEHFSQAFARFFMRVGLPSSIPKWSAPHFLVQPKWESNKRVLIRYPFAALLLPSLSHAVPNSFGVL
jgi:hypothetical protein